LPIHAAGSAMDFTGRLLRGLAHLLQAFFGAARYFLDAGSHFVRNLRCLFLHELAPLLLHLRYRFLGLAHDLQRFFGARRDELRQLLALAAHCRRPVWRAEKSCASALSREEHSRCGRLYIHEPYCPLQKYLCKVRDMLLDSIRIACLGTLAREISAISSTGLSPSVAALSRAFDYRLIW
jgi:hypothetical protein